ncbi:hypothetical protein FHS85_000928 [Rhodoligotrophos appendicifer]|uniref:hypothetical protein n=1 Tax=Rhodoligotrophos appendicifer TaxID=987056 RepID=UPI00117C96F1|nr:hypothetical protein [Rhodoligotrophos appendicifer]
MQYLGRISGTGRVMCDGGEIGQASYDFEGFNQGARGVTSSGEVCMAAAILKDVFGRPNIQLLTEDGRLLNLRFSSKQLLASADAAHVDVTGDLPTARGWH